MERVILLENLQIAYFKARRGKQHKEEIQRYAYKLDDNLRLLQQQLISGRIDVGHYHYFKIYDPKERLICSARFEERVLHHALMNVCQPYFERVMISDTYATRIGKGTYAAINKAREGARKYRYVAKLDFRKYFDSISHDILKQRLQTLFKDNQLLEIFSQIIDSYSIAEGFGLPIGNLTSQYFANFYLSDLDHRIKEKWHIPVYVRYMDDMLLFANDKVELKNVVHEIESYVSSVLHLTLKPPQFLETSVGVSFCGYRIYPHHWHLNSRSKRRFRRKNNLYLSLLQQSIWSEREFQMHVLPLYAFARKAYTKRFCHSIIQMDEI